ncbi:MAG TPA: 3-hydroxyacyl-CoA dehydrogenase NAD-binding domain-containing protein [Acidiferrobacterales bacterium]|nr:3-hydroxyacyl-CoA dehydrogenase NAD-binding domain-containing protein [Acidiferrobacterales bacterium]
MVTSSSSAAIIGGGTMGADIALLFAVAGWQTHILEISDAARADLPDRLKNGLSRMGGQDKILSHLHSHAAMKNLPWPQIEIVVECVPENLALKRQVFHELENYSRPDTILASNSSSFPISQIGGDLKNPARIAGLHFFMPAHLVPVVEVVRCETTDPALPEKLDALMRSLGKVPVQVRRDIPGFLANRIQHALMREALALVEDGIASVEDVDIAVRFGFGFRFLGAGPLLQKDLSGLDIHYNAATTIYPHLCNDSAPSKVLGERVRAGKLGVKSGEGFYAWTKEKSAQVKADYDALLSAGLKLLRKEITKAT